MSKTALGSLLIGRWVGGVVSFTMADEIEYLDGYV